jgi:hypothetical protein
MRSRTRIRTLTAAASLLPSIAHAVDATWTSPTSGSWTNVARWSTSPNYPDNDTPAGASYDATIAAAGNPYAVTFLTNATINSLSLGSQDAEFDHTAGTLQANTAVIVNAGSYQAYSGTLKTPLLTGAATGANFSITQEFTFAPGMTLAMPVAIAEPGGSLNLPGGLTLAAGGSITSARYLTAAGTISGPGAIRLDDATFYGTTSGPPVTLAPDLTVTTTPTGSGTLFNQILNQGTISAEHPGRSISLSGSFTNSGTVRALSGGAVTASGAWTSSGQITAAGASSLTLTGNTWSNTGTVSVTGNSTLTLGGTPSTVGSISLTDSTLRLSGIATTTAALHPISFANSTLVVYFNAVLDNTADTLALSPATATLTVRSGTFKGGTITGPAGVPVVFSTPDSVGSLSALTLAADASIVPASTLSFTGGLTLANNARVTLSGGSAAAILSSSSTQTLDGTGEIVFDGPTGSSAILRSSTGTLTIGANVTLRTGANSGFLGFSPGTITPYTVQGTVSAQTPGKSISINATTLTNTGTLEAKNAATLSINARTIDNAAGLITIDPTSTLLITSGSTPVPAGRIRLAGTAALNYSTGFPSPIDTARQQLLLGLTSAGADGLSYPAAPTDPTHTLAYVEASQLLHLTATQTSTFAGLPVDSTTLLLFPTLTGDTNLDGHLNADDYATLDRSLAKSTPNAHWTDGDFNYDGTINNEDYFLIDRTFLLQGGPLDPTFLATRESRFGPDYVSSLLTNIPEPTLPLSSLLLLAPLRGKASTWREVSGDLR